MRHGYRYAIILVGLATVSWLFLIIAFHKEPATLNINYLAVGQGDAALVTTAKKQKILIDCGPDQEVLTALDRHLAWWDRRLDLVFISHDHSDHWAGLNYLLPKYKIKQIIIARPPRISSELATLLTRAQNQGIGVINIQAPATIRLADQSQLTILWPNQQQITAHNKNINNQSLVINWRYGHQNFLWTGDLESDAEQEILAQQSVDFVIDVLKVAHHGSLTATSLVWLNHWQPKLAVISVGANNQFNLPSQLTLDRLKRFNIQLWRTDQSDDLKLISNGQLLWLAD